MTETTVWETWTCPTCEREWKGNRPHSHLCPDGTLYVSASTISSMVCDAQAWLRAMGASTPGESIPAFAGQCVHVALATYYRTWDVAAAEQAFQEAYQPYADLHVDPNGPLVRLTYENTSVVFREWLRRYKIDSEGILWTSAGNAIARVHPSLVEVPFQVMLSEEHKIVIIGILDALVEEYQSGQWLVKDHKSTGQLDKRWWAKWQLDAQPSCYVWAAAETTEKPVMGLIINGLEFSKLPSDPKRKCYLHKVPYAECAQSHAKIDMVQFDRTAIALEDWRREATKQARELRQLLLAYPNLEDATKLRVQGRFRNACLNCFASPYCAGDRVKAVAEAFDIHEGMVSTE